MIGIGDVEVFPATASTTASTSARPAASNRCCGDTVEGSFHSSVERIRRYAGGFDSFNVGR